MPGPASRPRTNDRRRDEPDPAPGADGRPLRLQATPEALRELRAALGARGPDAAVRLFVGGGSHPQVGMTVDRATPRDEVIDLDGVRVVVDNGSRPFLDDGLIEFVVGPSGGGFRVTGPNTPSPPAPAEPAEGAAAPPIGGTPAEQARAALKSVYDPEIPMNIVDLGLIYRLAIDPEGRADVAMTMTSPGCPVAEMLVEQVRTAVGRIPGVTKVEVEVVWEPPWSPEKMSEFAKRQLGFA